MAPGSGHHPAEEERGEQSGQDQESAHPQRPAAANGVEGGRGYDPPGPDRSAILPNRGVSGLSVVGEAFGGHGRAPVSDRERRE